MSEIRKLETSKDGDVLVTVGSKVTEQEIAEEREVIVLRLHSAYLNLTDYMAEFQAQWDESPALAYITSAYEGWNAGGAEWLNDQTEFFNRDLWISLGDKVKDAAGNAYDRLATYSAGRFESVQKEVNKHLANPEETLLNWAWWQRSISDTASQMGSEQVRQLDSIGHNMKTLSNSVFESAEMATKIYKHRDAILNLPTLIANGEPRPIQNFVDTVLVDIDPKLAKAIRDDPNFPVVLEVIADHESALSYLAYVGLMIEAIPPNFYAYIAGKGGAYLMIEIVMLIVTALLSAGAAAATRITMLIARFAAAGAKVVTANRKIKRAKAAIDAFLRMLHDLCDAVDELHSLGAKLLEARSKGYVIRGNTKTTLLAKRKSIKREKKCRCCGSTEHTTPRTRPGHVEYI